MTDSRRYVGVVPTFAAIAVVILIAALVMAYA